MAYATLWIAGPVQYFDGNYQSFKLAWDFVGGNVAGEIRRWRLRYNPERRLFLKSDLKSDTGDQGHARKLRELYAHVAVRRQDLPKGDIIVALKAMLSPADLADAVRRSIERGAS